MFFLNVIIFDFFIINDKSIHISAYLNDYLNTQDIDYQ